MVKKLRRCKRFLYGLRMTDYVYQSNRLEDEGIIWKPEYDMEFDCEQAAYDFYNAYGRRKGVGIRRKAVGLADLQLLLSGFGIPARLPDGGAAPRALERKIESEHRALRHRQPLQGLW